MSVPKSLRSLYRERVSEWAGLYQILEQQLGADSTLVDFGNQYTAGKLTATSWTGRKFNASGLSPTWTPSEALSAWDGFATGGNPLLEASWQGYALKIKFNGTDEEADTPDAAFFTRDDSAGQGFSIGGWFNFNATGDQCIMSKYDATGASEAREWLLQIESGKIKAYIFDETQNVNCSRVTDAVVQTGAAISMIVVYSGAGGATAGNGITIYVNGAVAASTATNNASYVQMRDTATVVRLGYAYDGSNINFFSGTMFGGPFSPFFKQTAMTAEQVYNYHNNLRLRVGI